MFRKTRREIIRRPMPATLSENYPVPHAPKKPILAVTGTKPDRLCAICLGKLEPGTALTFCNCGKYFHMVCISELGKCPICDFIFTEGLSSPETEYADAHSEDNYSQDDEIIETVYQCPICESYVPENSERCECGAVFDTEEYIYLCPQCGHEVSADSERCVNCGMAYD